MKPETPFAVGEVVWYWRPGSNYHKTECTVVGELEFGSVMDVNNGLLYEAWFHYIDGPFPVVHYPWGEAKNCAELHMLRKIPGRGDLELTSWDDCVFDPNRLIIKV